MDDQDSAYNIAAIRKLLMAAFTAGDLRQFCHDRPRLCPLLDRFSPNHGLTGMVEEVITYCEKRSLFDHLLDQVRLYNPAQHDRHGPYRCQAGTTPSPSPSSSYPHPKDAPLMTGTQPTPSQGDTAMQDEPWSPTEEYIRKLIARGPSDTVVFLPTVPPSALFARHIFELAQNREGFILIGVDQLGDTLGVDTNTLLSLPSNAAIEFASGVSFDSVLMPLDGKAIGVYRVKPKSTTGRRKTTAQTQPPANATEAAKRPTAPQGQPRALQSQPPTPDQANDKASVQERAPDLAAAIQDRESPPSPPLLPPYQGPSLPPKQENSRVALIILDVLFSIVILGLVTDIIAGYYVDIPRQIVCPVAVIAVLAVIAINVALARPSGHTHKRTIALVGVLLFLVVVPAVVWFLQGSNSAVNHVNGNTPQPPPTQPPPTQPSPTQPPAPTSSPVVFCRDSIDADQDIQTKAEDTDGFRFQGITVTNYLFVAVGITVSYPDGLPATIQILSRTAQFVGFTAFPPGIKWTAVNQMNSDGVYIGNEMKGSIDSSISTALLASGTLSITPMMDEKQPYFYPIVTNNFTQTCAVTVNEGLHDQLKPCSIEAGAKRIGLGYYKWLKDSKVAFNCGGVDISPRYLLPIDEGWTPPYTHPDAHDGAIEITIGP